MVGDLLVVAPADRDAVSGGAKGQSSDGGRRRVPFFGVQEGFGEGVVLDLQGGDLWGTAEVSRCSWLGKSWFGPGPGPGPGQGPGPTSSFW